MAGHAPLATPLSAAGMGRDRARGQPIGARVVVVARLAGGNVRATVNGHSLFGYPACVGVVGWSLDGAQPYRDGSGSTGDTVCASGGSVSSLAQMNARPTILILGAGLLLAVGAYCAAYFTKVSAHKELERSAAPELAWLKTEFKLTEPEFERVAKLDASYYPECREMCRRIAAKN